MTNTIILITLSNQDTALFVNDVKIYDLDANDEGPSLVYIADQLGEALGTTVRSINMEVPSDDDWNWNDVYDLLSGHPSLEEDNKSFDQLSPDMQIHWISKVRTESNCPLSSKEASRLANIAYQESLE